MDDGKPRVVAGTDTPALQEGSRRGHVFRSWGFGDFGSLHTALYCQPAEALSRCALGDNDAVIPGPTSEEDIARDAGSILGFRPGYLAFYRSETGKRPYAILPDNTSDFARGTRRHIPMSVLGCYGYFVPDADEALRAEVELHYEPPSSELSC